MVESIEQIRNTKYKNLREVKKAISDMPGSMFDSKSATEKATMDLILKLSNEYAWRLYLALYDFIDSFLF